VTLIPRLQLIEVHDQPWCPRGVRDAVTDLLQAVLTLVHHYGVAAPVLSSALRRSGATTVVDLGSGGGGPWLRLLPELAATGVAPDLVLTDKYPNADALNRLRVGLGNRVRVEAAPIDAAAVPTRLGGFRTLFTTFHHFSPPAAAAVLRDAQRGAEGIAVFEVTHRSLAALALMLGFVLTPLAVPFLRPFRWDRLLWTFVVPVVPLVALWDAIVSCLRTYTPDELRALVRDADDWDWEARELPRRWWPVPVTCLIGYPKSAKERTMGR